MKRVVLHHIASDIGKKSSVGIRSQKIYEYAKNNYEISILCRKSFMNRSKNIWTIDLSYFLSRIFFGIRLYIFYRFPARKYEIFFFNLLSIPYILFHYLMNFKNIKILHTWDTSYWLLIILKKLGYVIIRDMSMTPTRTSIKEAKRNPRFYVDKISTTEDAIIEEKIFQISNIITSPSKFTTNFIKNHYKVDQKKIKTIPFGVNQKKYYFINKTGIKKNTLKLGFVGLVNKRKGIRWLIESLNLLEENNNSGFEFELHLFGRIYGEDIEFINKAKFKLIKYGFIDTQKTNIYNFFDLLIHPSFVEGSAKCIYEAMSSGLPIICTIQSGSLVEDKKNGFLINAGDTKKLISSINYFLSKSDELVKMGKHSKSIIRKI